MLPARAGNVGMSPCSDHHSNSANKCFESQLYKTRHKYNTNKDVMHVAPAHMVISIMGVFIIFHWAQFCLPARWRHNMAPRGRMLIFQSAIVSFTFFHCC